MGLGSSGASAAAAVKAVSILLGIEPGEDVLVEAAGRGEAAAAGTPHYDNVAASILGGLTIVATDAEGRLYVKRLEFDAWFAVYVPRPRIQAPAKTKLMREVLPKSIPLAVAARNWSRLAMLVAAAATRDLRLMGVMMMQDEIIEAARQKYIACYSEAKRAALDAGALGVSISGAGPSIIALAGDEKTARSVAEAWLSRCACCEADIVKVARVAPPATQL
jgi:homoserine kinase